MEEGVFLVSIKALTTTTALLMNEEEGNEDNKQTVVYLVAHSCSSLFTQCLLSRFKLSVDTFCSMTNQLLLAQ